MLKTEKKSGSAGEYLTVCWVFEAKDIRLKEGGTPV